MSLLMLIGQNTKTVFPGRLTINQVLRIIRERKQRAEEFKLLTKLVEEDILYQNEIDKLKSLEYLISQVSQTKGSDESRLQWAYEFLESRVEKHKEMLNSCMNSRKLLTYRDIQSYNTCMHKFNEYCNILEVLC